MPVQININGVDAAEALKELSSLAAGFNSNAASSPVTKQEEAPKRQTRAKAEPEKQQEKSEPQKEEKASDLGEDDLGFDEEPIPDDVQLRTVATQKSKSAGRDKVKALLDKYEVPNVTAVPKDKRRVFLQELEVLA
jgi:LAS superfamily LD-carboxypeptidase LdcB